MIVSKVQKRPKIKNDVVVGPQASAAKTAILPKVSAAKTAAMPQVCVHTRIRERAFEMFEKRGSSHGYDLQDWFHAERQLQAQ
jgi:hypothetical protein